MGRSRSEDIEVSSSGDLPPGKKEKADGRKRNGRPEGKKARGGEPVEALPGWAKARAAVRKKDRAAEPARPEGGGVKPKHTNFGLSVGGVRGKVKSLTHEFKSRLNTFSKPRSRDQFKSPKPKNA